MKIFFCSVATFHIADVMVLNDIIEQAAGRHSRASEHGGECDIVS